MSATTYVGSAPVRILIVEDEPTARAALHDLLTEEGYAVEVASCGRSAVERRRAVVPDLVLADFGLPDVDGLTVARLAQAECGCAAVIMTGDETIRHARLEFAVLMKPLVVARLLDHIQRALAHRGDKRALAHHDDAVITVIAAAGRA